MMMASAAASVSQPPSGKLPSASIATSSASAPSAQACRKCEQRQRQRGKAGAESGDQGQRTTDFHHDGNRGAKLGQGQPLGADVAHSARKAPILPMLAGRNNRAHTRGAA